MNRIQRSALVRYTPKQMFDLINDVERYPEFMPGCAGAKILEQGENWLVARLDLAKSGIKQSFVTRNTLIEPSSMSIRLEDGPFSSLNGQWQFDSLGDSGCKVSLWLEFEFSNPLLKLAASRVFESVASSQVDSVCERAKHIYP